MQSRVARVSLLRKNGLITVLPLHKDAMSRARWEMDLSGGIVTVVFIPERGLIIKAMEAILQEVVKFGKGKIKPKALPLSH